MTGPSQTLSARRGVKRRKRHQGGEGGAAVRLASAIIHQDVRSPGAMKIFLVHEHLIKAGYMMWGLYNMFALNQSGGSCSSGVRLYRVCAGRQQIHWHQPKGSQGLKYSIGKEVHRVVCCSMWLCRCIRSGALFERLAGLMMSVLICSTQGSTPCACMLAACGHDTSRRVSVADLLALTIH